MFKWGVKWTDKTREKALEVFYWAFAPVRKIIRNWRNPINPVPYEIIHGNPYATTVATVRSGGPIAHADETTVFHKRQGKVKEAQEKFLGVKFAKNEKPLVMTLSFSGGGQRARIGATGSMLGAERIGLLSCFTYGIALSGSTWALAPYLLSKKTPEQYRNDVLENASRGLGLTKASKNIIDAMDMLSVKFAFGQSINIVDLYGILLAIDYLKKIGQDDGPQRVYLSSLADNDDEIGKKMNNGEMIIPIFTAITAEIIEDKEWCFFTPWEFGSRWFGREGGGAYIPVWAFARGFKGDRSINWGSASEPLYGPRPSLAFLMGIWGSAFAATAQDAYDLALNGMKKGPIKTLVKHIMTKTPIKKLRLLWAESFNFLYRKSGFLYADKKYLKLADAGFATGCPIFPSYRRPKDGKIKEGSAPDIIIVCDYSATVDEGEKGDKDELGKHVRYAKAKKLPFPEIDYGRLKGSIITIFKDKPKGSKFKDYEIPTVIYMPRIMDPKKIVEYINKKDEMAKRLKKFDIKQCMKTFCDTFNFDYYKGKKPYKQLKLEQKLRLPSGQLSTLTAFNIMASEDKIKKAMLDRMALNRKRDGIKGTMLIKPTIKGIKDTQGAAAAAA